MPNPKQIPDPDNEGQMIDNPDFDPTKNEDGTPIEPAEDNRTDIEKAVAAALAPIKARLNSAYEAKDAAEARTKELEKLERDRETARLRDAGQEKEAHARELEDLQNQMKELTKANVGLTRDRDVSDALATYEFRNAKARAMAVKDITTDLVKDANGVWVSREGKSIADHAKAFFEDADNQFLLKPKRSTGTGGDAPLNPAPGTQQKPKSIFDVDPSEVMRNILAGKPARG